MSKLVYGPYIATSGLQLCLDAANAKSYPGYGTNWHDVSGKGNDGTLGNGPTFSSASMGNILFDGIDDFCQIGKIGPTTSTKFDITNAFTIEMVCLPLAAGNIFTFDLKGPVQPNPSPSGYDRGISLSFPYSDGNVYYDIYNTSGNLYRWVKSGASFNTPILNDIGVYHITLNTSSVLTIKQNGVTITGASTAYSGLTFAGTVNLGEYNMLGAFNSAGVAAANVRIYSFKIYNRLLTDEETVRNYNALKTRFNLT